MNRSVLARQMFARGGAAFPDLSGDNKITQKDILMGRGVPMQMGGEPQMALGDYLGGQTDELAAEAARLGISKEQLLELLNQQAMQPQADARSRNPDMANYIDESGELFYDPASGAASRRQMFDEAAAIAAKYQQPVGMAMGGDPAMAQGVGSMMAPPPAMPEGQGMGDAQAMDPQVLEGLLGQAQENLGNIDEAEDYETVINSIRGDDAPISARYEELAGVVGEEDAAQTPESVLTLVQPAIMMGGVDEGIGGLAQAEMTEPVEGAMAQGIMSTVAPPPPAAPMPPGGMGGPPPVNFNQGGLVRRGDNQPVQMYANGGETRFFGPRVGLTPDQSRVLRQQVDTRNLQVELAKAKAAPSARPLTEVFDAQRKVYGSVLGDSESRAAELEEQKNLTQAQVLFDIAGTALAFAAPMEGERRGMSPAERLAMAASTTKLLPTIGARAQQQLDAKKAARKEEQTLDLAALQSAETIQAAESAAAAKYRQKEMELRNQLEKLGPGEKLYDREGNVVASGMGQPIKGIPANVFNSLTQDAKNTIMGLDQTIKGVPKSVYDGLSESDQQKLLGVKAVTEPDVKGIPRDVFDTLTQDAKNTIMGLDQTIKGVPKSIYDGLSESDQQKLLGVKAVQDLPVKGIPRDIFDGLSDKAKAAITTPDVKGVPASIFNQLTRPEQMKLLGVAADSVSGIPRAIFDGLDKEDQRKVLLGAQSAEVKIKDIPKSVFDKLPDALKSQILGGVITVAKGHKVIDISKEGKPKVIAEGKGETRVLSPGQIVVDENNNTIAEGPAKQLVDDDVKYLSDASRISKYANNTLGDETAQFEQAILDYSSKPRGLVFDGKNYVPSEAPGLNRQLVAAIQAREAAGHGSVAPKLPQSLFTPVKPDTGDVSGDVSGLPTTPSGRVDITSPQFNATLFAEDGSVDLNSSSWDNVPINIIDKNLDYPGTTGLVSGVQKLKNYFGENLREIGGSGLSEEGKDFSRAEADMLTIRNRVLSYITQGGAVDGSDRILKMVQEQLMDETNKLTPGMFTTDETALSKLSAVEGQLASNFQTLSQRVPEYGGKVGDYSEGQIKAARGKLGTLKNLIAEVRTLRKIYEKALDQGALGLTPANRKSAKAWLQGNRAANAATGDIDG